MPFAHRFSFRVAGLVVITVALVSAPFVIWGDDYVHILLGSWPQQSAGIVLLAIGLLMADAVAPVPATLVIMFLAAKAGWIAGVVGGTVGLSCGVLVAAWFGREAVGRIAPRLFPDAELSRLRAGLHRNLALTLACWRSIPVIAEASVILAASAGIPVGRIFRVTLLPNFAIALVYSLAASDSFATASAAFVAVAGSSLLLGRLGHKSARPGRRPH